MATRRRKIARQSNGRRTDRKRAAKKTPSVESFLSDAKKGVAFVGKFIAAGVATEAGKIITDEIVRRNPSPAIKNEKRFPVRKRRVTKRAG